MEARAANRTDMGREIHRRRFILRKAEVVAFDQMPLVMVWTSYDFVVDLYPQALCSGIASRREGNLLLRTINRRVRSDRIYRSCERHRIALIAENAAPLQRPPNPVARIRARVSPFSSQPRRNLPRFAKFSCHLRHQWRASAPHPKKQNFPTSHSFPLPAP